VTAAPAGGGLAEVLGLVCRLYADAYHSGHHATVEGGYIDVLHVDRDSYWLEEVNESELVNYLRSHGEAIAALPAKWRNDAETGVFTNGSGDAFREALNDCADELDAAIAKAGGQQHG